MQKMDLYSKMRYYNIANSKSGAMSLMGISRHKLSEYNFALTRIFGDIDDRQLKQYVLDNNRDSENMVGIRALADCRNVKSVSLLSVHGTIDAAFSEQGQPRVKGGKLAILVADTPLLYGLARVYQSVASLNWQDVNIFQDLSQALAWLGFGDSERPVITGFIESGGIVSDP